MWSHSFLAVEYLLGVGQEHARFDWAGLTVARFAPAGMLCAVYCIGRRRAESRAILRRHPLRLGVSCLLAVWIYQLALSYGQERGVPAPIASLLTALTPLYLLLLAALFLGERLTPRKGLAFLVSLTGMVLISGSREGGGDAYPLLIAIAAVAPLCWSIYTVVSKPLAGSVDLVLWTYLMIAVAGVPGLLVLPWIGGPQMAALDAPGWAALLFLCVLCTVVGFALWTWLLRYLPASTVGLTVFLNPPLTTAFQWLWAQVFPGVFQFRVAPAELVGGALALLGVAIAVMRRPR